MLRSALTVLFLSAALVAVTQAQSITPSPVFEAADLAQLPGQAWVTNGGNILNQRHSTLTQINKDNIDQVKANWRVHLDGSGSKPNNSGQGQILAYEGTLYVVTGENDVFAYDVQTGNRLWKYEARLRPEDVHVCCGWVSRGLGMGEGKIFVGQLNGKLVALDQISGEKVWEIQAESPQLGYSITSAPLYFNGMIITGFAGGEMGIRGRVKAFDAKNGDLLWTFYTIPGPGEFGHDTWPQDSDIWQFGGAPVWQTPTVDPDLGMVYFTTGNAAPDYNGAVREGDNLFTVSMLALDVYTGEYKWHFQQVHHDIWDYDSPNPTILFDAPYNGVMRKGIAEVSKTGWIYILDRITGEPLIGIEERPVPQEPNQKTAATQPYVIGDSVVPQFVDIAPEGIKLINGGKIFTPFWTETVIYKPQMAVNWPPSSYDPDSNVMFVCGIDNLGISTSDGLAEFEEPTHDTMWLAKGPATAEVSFPRRGIFSAVDLKTNRLLWQRQWAEGCMSGSINTAGGLILAGRSDGRLTAMDKDDGSILWSFRTDSGVNAPATTFMHKGVQYIAVMSAGTIYSASVHGDSVWLFSLTGTMDEIAADGSAGIGGAVVANAALPAVQIAAGAADLQAGEATYKQICVSCHGDKGIGGHADGASLAPAAGDLQRIVTTVTRGQNDRMPAFGSIYTPEQIRDVASYINKVLF